ncbi:MAG TPA: hypothetical protein VER96_05490 [Polyangiaceae bacterium]|nr:hypothetical protein [Polyangiaceae bacterium]
MMRVTRFFPTVMVAALVVGCGGGQTGDLSGQNDRNGRATEGGDGCDDQLKEISLDDASALGFDAASVLTFAEQRFQSELAWQALSQVEYSPSASQSSLSLTLSSRNKAWFVHSVPTPSDDKGGGVALALICPPDRLRMDVHADLQSADGALAESFDGAIEASSRYVATLSRKIDPKQLSGSFAISHVSAPDVAGPSTAAVENLTFDAVLTPGGMAGTLTGQLTSQNAQVASSSVVSFARFPGDARCAAEPGNGGAAVPVSADSAALGQTGSQALSEVNGWGPIALTWDNGRESPLTVELSKLEDGCVQVAPNTGFNDPRQPAASVVYPVTLKATTADGRWQGQYAASLVTWPNADGQGFSERIEMHGTFAVSAPAATGFTQVTIPSDAQRLNVRLEALFASANASGHVALEALKDPPCVTNPEPPSANSAPGCSGTSVTPVLGGTWGEN